MLFQLTLEQCQAQCCAAEWGCLAIAYAAGMDNKQCLLYDTSHVLGTATKSSGSFAYHYKGPNFGVENTAPVCTGAEPNWYEVPNRAVAKTAYITSSSDGHTLEECKAMCCNAARHWCKGFDFQAGSGTCRFAEYNYNEIEFSDNSNFVWYGAYMPPPPSPPSQPNTGYFSPLLQASWHEARTHCENYGGIIAVPHSNDELEAIWAARSGGTSFWLGIHDLNGDNVWEGLGGTKTWAGYTNWYRSGDNQQPPIRTDGIERCVVARYQSGHGWVSNSCDTNRRFMCQWVTPPHPATPPSPPARHIWPWVTPATHMEIT